MNTTEGLRRHLDYVARRNLGVVMLQARQALQREYRQALQREYPVTSKANLARILEDLSEKRRPNKFHIIVAFTWARTPFTFRADFHEGRPVKVEDWVKATMAVRKLIEILEEENEGH